MASRNGAESALIVGVGTRISASFARLCAREGMTISLASRNADKLSGLAEEIGGKAFSCDASKRDDVDRLFARVVETTGVPDLVLYNASGRTRGPLVELDAEAVERSLMVSCYGGFLVGQSAAKLMIEKGHGTILFTGASASVKGYPESAPFAMGKFGLRGLAQSMARELQPKNIHVGHFVIDGGVRRPTEEGGNLRGPDGMLDPDAIAETYLHVHRQHRSAWTWEIELRPWVEKF